MPRREGMERKDLLRANAGIFKVQGAALNKVARKTVKVLVVGNPANTNALIVSHYAPSIPRESFSALTRLDQNRAQSLNVIIWGNHSNTQYPDISHATVRGQNVQVERTWYEDKFLKTVQTRGAAVLSARKLSSALSAAKAIADHLYSWLNGTTDGCCSMAVVSKGDYGIPEGLFYSMPVTCRDGQWSVVTGLQIDEYSRLMMDRTAKELIEERDEALEYLGDC
ncbi:Malate dehydrogenase, partial [Paramicrosporidium saccamoebae]